MATSANQAGTSYFATSAGQAGTALLATSAGAAGTAFLASSANQAGTAYLATSAAQAGTAGIAGTAAYASSGAFLKGATQALVGTSGTFTLDFSQAGGFYGTANLSAMVVAFSNPTEGGVYRFQIRQGTAGTATIASWTQMDGTNGFWLNGGTAGTLSTAAGKRDVVTIWYVNSVYMASYVNG